MDWEKIEWHDGVIQRLVVDFSEDSICELYVNLPLSATSAERTNYRITVRGLIRLNSNLDVLSLLRHRSFGNISDGKVFLDPPERLILILAEGYLEAVGSKLECSEL